MLFFMRNSVTIPGRTEPAGLSGTMEENAYSGVSGAMAPVTLFQREEETFSGADREISPKPECVLCLGFFDGVHLGHQELIREACRVREKTGLAVYVHTFEVPPAAVLTGNAPACLTDNARKEALLLACGADRVIFDPFDRETSALTGKEYFENRLLARYGCRHIVAGEDHRFGRDGDTGAAELRALCALHGIGLSLIAPVCTPDGQRVSSSRIRRAIENGETALAACMLGRPEL